MAPAPSLGLGHVWAKCPLRGGPCHSPFSRKRESQLFNFSFTFSPPSQEREHQDSQGSGGRDLQPRSSPWSMFHLRAEFPVGPWPPRNSELEVFLESNPVRASSSAGSVTHCPHQGGHWPGSRGQHCPPLRTHLHGKPGPLTVSLEAFSHFESHLGFGAGLGFGSL